MTPDKPYVPKIYIVAVPSDRDYFCKICLQLRRWCRKESITHCGNCGSTNIVVDKPGSKELEQMRDAAIASNKRKSPTGMPDLNFEGGYEAAIASNKAKTL